MISNIILKSLIENRVFARKVLPYIKSEYFNEIEKKVIFDIIKNYIIEYKNLPTLSLIKIELNKKTDLSDSILESIFDHLDKLQIEEIKEYDDLWLIDSCEQWCKDRSLHNAILESVELIEHKKNTNIIPEIIRKALQIEFNSSIGINYFNEKGINDRWELYNKEDIKYATNIISLDNVFSGGIETKSLTILMSGTTAGKTSSMCCLTSNFLRNGKNVLYITLEMAEEKIAQRIDANFLDVEINDVPLMKESNFKKRILDLKLKTMGDLVIKEFPPAAISVSNIRNLLEDLKIKLNFEPQIIVIDYLNLMVSDRIKKDQNSYTLIKSIAEEIRGLGVEKELSILSATQGNRQTNDENNSDIDFTNVSESIGLPATCDALIGIIFPKELREQNIQIWKILKNRFGGIVNHKIPLRVNFAKALISELDDNEKNNFRICDNSQQNQIQEKVEERRLKQKNTIIIEDDPENDIISGSFEDLLR